MNVLFLTQVLPYPLDAGPKLRAYFVLRALARQHAVTLVSFTRSDDAAAAVAHLRGICAAVHTVPMVRSPLRTARAGAVALATGEPVIIARDAVTAMQRTLAAIMQCGPIDVVHADQTAMVQYALWAADRQQPRPALVVDAHNALYQVFRRLAEQTANPVKRRVLAWEAGRIEAYERRTYALFDEAVFVTAVDRARFDLPHARVIPICGEIGTPVARQPGAQQVGFVGTLFWPPNAQGVGWFLDEVWPRVRAQAPAATFVAAGKAPPADLVCRAEAMPGVRLAGYVAELAPLLAGCALLVVPLHAGGGMRVKIVDGWGWGLPMVSTTVGAEGLAYTPGEELLIADDAEAFAAAVVRLLCDPALGARLAEAGRRHATEHYDWRRVYGAWEEVYDAALERAGRAPVPAEAGRAL